MEIQDLQALLNTPTDLIKAIQETKSAPEKDEFYEPETHKVTQRKDRKIDKGNGVIDPITGKEGITATYEPVNKITVSLQKLIIDQGVAIATAVPIQIESKPVTGPEQVLDAMLRKTWKDNKVSYKDSEILELTMKDTECAEVWYSEPVDPEYWNGTGTGSFKMRLKVIAPSKGDTLYPLFNVAGDMISFARGYKIKVDGKDIEHLDLYTATNIFKYEKAQSDWVLLDTIAISYLKIQVIYHSQPKTETADVNGKIERLEFLLSMHGDTNEANGTPILALSGAVTEWASRGEAGKTVILENGADLKYVTWDNAPLSIKLEIENLIKFIYDETRTINLSPDVINGLGSISGVALELLFLAAHLKAKKRQNGSFGEAIQRRLNFLKSAMVAINNTLKPAINLDMTPKFGLYMPDNVTENIDNAATLVAAGIISKQTALRQLNLVDDVEAEFELIKIENDSIGAL